MRDTANSRKEQYIKCCVTREISMREGKKRPYKFVHLKNFGQNKKVSKKEKNAEQFYKSTSQFLSKIIAWCESKNIPPGDVEQFITLPMAIATPDGLPIQKQKADARKYLSRHFKDAFLDTITLLQPKTLVLDGMVVIYACRPSASHNTFGDYAKHIFSKWVHDKFRLKEYKEIHFCFDRQTDDIESPKSIERDRRDSRRVGGVVFDQIHAHTNTPYNWMNFLSHRANKKHFVHFLCEYLVLEGTRLLSVGHKLIVSGGFKTAGLAQMVIGTADDEEKEDAITLPYCNNHIEADTMVYLHAVNSSSSDEPIVIYSSDTDIIHIGLPVVTRYPSKHFIVQLKESAGQNLYVDLNKLLSVMEHGIDLIRFGKVKIAEELQTLFVCTGCDYVSFFQHNSKLSFYDAYFDNVQFISGDDKYVGCLSQTSPQNYECGFRAFCRLLGCVFSRKCAGMFEYSMKFKKKPSPREIYEKIREANVGMSEEDILLEWLNAIRQNVMKSAGCGSEDYWLPSNDSLMLHWKRCCYVVQVWQQTINAQIIYPTITQWGWSYANDQQLVFRWDSDSNLRHIDKYRRLWTSGCKCKSLTRACGTMVCGCKKQAKPCGPACLCTDSCLNKPCDPSVKGLLSAMPDNHDDSSDDDVVILKVVSAPCLTDEEEDMDEDDAD